MLENVDRGTKNMSQALVFGKGLMGSSVRSRKSYCCSDLIINEVGDMGLNMSLFTAPVYSLIK